MTTESSDAGLSRTERTQLRRFPERAHLDRADLYAVLDAGFFGHLGLIVDGSPRVIPVGYGRDGDTLYIHGSAEAQSLNAAAHNEVCMNVMHLDGIVLARSIFRHSLNYRSAIIYGRPRAVTDPAEKTAALHVVAEGMAPGQWDVARHPDETELSIVTVIAMPLAEASVKVRTGPPRDEERDLSSDVWAGVLPIHQTYGTPISETPDRPVPAHISDRIPPGQPRDPAT